MAIEDFDYILTPYDALTLSNGHWRDYTGLNYGWRTRWNFMKAYGNNGRPYFNEEAGKYERKYTNYFECSDWDGYNSSGTETHPGKIIHHLNYVKHDKLKQLGVMDENGIIKSDKMISIRMRLKISNRIGAQANESSTAKKSYFRHYAGIVLFGQRPPNILDYQGTDDNGVPYNVEKFSWGTYAEMQSNAFKADYIGENDFLVTAPPDLPGTPRYICSGYNFLICSDGRKVDEWDGQSISGNEWVNEHPQKRHISLYNYGVDTMVAKDTSSPSADNYNLSSWNSSNWKLHQAELIENQLYDVDTWYRIRLDYIPITTFSRKLITYVARDGDLNWTKTGESIVDDTDKKYITTGDIGFVVSTHVTPHVESFWHGNWSGLSYIYPYSFHEPYRDIVYTEVAPVESSAVVDTFEILTEDIPSI